MLNKARRQTWGKRSIVDIFTYNVETLPIKPVLAYCTVLYGRLFKVDRLGQDKRKNPFKVDRGDHLMKVTQGVIRGNRDLIQQLTVL